MIDGTPLTFAAHFAATQFCTPALLLVPGSVTGSLPHGTCDVSGRSAAVYRFTKAAGGGIAFTTTAGFPSQVEVKVALGETNVAIQPTAQIPTGEWLLPNGEYLFRISTLGAGGNFTIAATPIAATTGTTARFIAAPGTFTQSLALSDREFGDGTMYDYFVLYSTRPCTITMRATAFDAVLFIDDAITLGFVDVNDTFEPGSTDARVVLPECNSDGNPIGILANSNPAPGGLPGLGSYTLSVEYAEMPPAVRAGRSASAAMSAVAQPDLPRLLLRKPARDRRR
jgi:hypothetical protein